MEPKLNQSLPLSLVVPSEEFELQEILIRADIDREVFATFDADTIEAIQEEVGLSAGLLPKLSSKEIEKIKIVEPLNIEKLEDIPNSSSPHFGTYFADIYMNGVYKWEGGYVVYKKNDTKEREKLLDLEGLSREFLLHPETIVKIRKNLQLIRPTDRVEQSMRHLGFAMGVLLGRFNAQMGCLVDLADEKRKEKGIAPDPKTPQALKAGLYFTSLSDLRGSIQSTVDIADERIVQELKNVLIYKLGEEGFQEVWKEMEIALLQDCDSNNNSIGWNKFFREKYFDLHLKKYDNRPIYFPLSSSSKNFVFYFNIHTWNPGTFSYILSEFLNPDLKALSARLDSLTQAKEKAEKSELKTIDKELITIQKLFKELEDFRDTLAIINTTGIDADKLEAKVPYFMDLDDGVMVNSSALHPLLNPLWNKPKEIWVNILKPQGKKDYDWSHLAMRYFPNRVLAKCKIDPSLAVAHSDYGEHKGKDLFKEFHPEASKKWEERNANTQDKVSKKSGGTMIPGMEAHLPSKEEVKKAKLEKSIASQKELAIKKKAIKKSKK